jgi:hypothetical protein
VAKKLISKKPVAKKPVSSKSGSSKLVSSKSGSSKSAPKKSAPKKSAPKKSAPDAATFSNADSSNAGSDNANSSQKSSAKTVPVNQNPIAAHMNLTLLEVADPSDLNVLMADPRIGMLIAARLSDSSAIITPDKTEALLKALKEAGHTPKIVRPVFRGAA